jgi:hypothetical protein
VLSAGSASASAPPALVVSTIKAAILLAAGQKVGYETLGSDPSLFWRRRALLFVRFGAYGPNGGNLKNGAGSLNLSLTSLRWLVDLEALVVEAIDGRLRDPGQRPLPILAQALTPIRPLRRLRPQWRKLG